MTAFLLMLGNKLILFGMVGSYVTVKLRSGVVALITPPVFFFSAIKLSGSIHHIPLKQQNCEDLVATTRLNLVGAIKAVQGLSISNHSWMHFPHRDKTFEQDVKASKLEAALQHIVNVLVTVSMKLLSWYCLLLVVGNELTLSKLVIFMSYLSFSFKPLQNMPSECILSAHVRPA